MNKKQNIVFGLIVSIISAWLIFSFFAFASDKVETNDTYASLRAEQALLDSQLAEAKLNYNFHARELQNRANSGSIIRQKSDEIELKIKNLMYKEPISTGSELGL